MQKHIVTLSNTIDMLLSQKNTSQSQQLRGVSVSVDFMEYRLWGHSADRHNQLRFSPPHSSLLNMAK